MLRRAGRASPARTKPSNRDPATGDNCATGRPRSVIVTVSPAAASATTADAFCFNARIPTSRMCYIVERPSRIPAIMQDRLQRTEATFDPLPFDADAARAYGRVVSAMTQAGHKPRGARAVDLLIAATT